ncbi:MAG: glycerate-2-kinase family protein, partial [Chloroflexota bacterium]|nr:glycerate-2-kinase family protein [Chloroflexota bacterium]
MQQNNAQFSPDLLRNKVIDRNGKLGRDACEIITSAIRAVDPYQCVTRNVSDQRDFIRIGCHDIRKSAFDRIIVIGLGKASLSMAKGVIDIFKDKILYAAIVTKDKGFQLEDGYGGVLKVYIGGHPIPTAASLNSTKLILSQLPTLTPRDLVIVLISGGGSALFTLPVQGISLDDIQGMTASLLKSGADINEINTLRKRLDQVKGGGLARLLYPAQIHTLILSDVIGDPLDMIASGPTVHDPTNIEDAFKIIEKYHLRNKLPQSILLHLQKERGNKGSNSEISEPTKIF